MQSQSALTAEVAEDDMAKEEGQGKKKRKRNKKKKNKNKQNYSELDESESVGERINNFMGSPEQESNSTVSQATGVRGFEEPEFTPLKEKLDESFFDD